MKIYKNSRKTVPEKLSMSVNYIRYICPFCKSRMTDYSLSINILKVKCPHCGNKIEFIWKES